MSTLEETRESITRMQDFDPDRLVREDELGARFSFDDAVRPAAQLVDLYNRLSINALADLPQPILQKLKNQADADYNKFQQILEYDPSVQNHIQVHENYTTAVTNAYSSAFNVLHPFISYGASVAVDFQRLENDARAAVQSIKDQAEKLTEDLRQSKEAAQSVLEDVRKVAAEQGVSQQSIYFKNESEYHWGEAEIWRNRTIIASIVLAVYALFSIIFHKIPFLAPDSTLEGVQLVTSKVLVFGVLSYLLYLSAKNFMSHKHNSIVNKHRQNALMTFNALAEAAQSSEGKEIVLSHAASCIFSPQETGYTGSRSESNSRSIIELMPKLMASSGS